MLRGGPLGMGRWVGGTSRVVGDEETVGRATPRVLRNLFQNFEKFLSHEIYQKFSEIFKFLKFFRMKKSRCLTPPPTTSFTRWGWGGRGIGGGSHISTFSPINNEFILVSCLDKFDPIYKDECSGEESWRESYYYDHATKKCTLFWHNGCHSASMNIFSHLGSCERLCEETNALKIAGNFLKFKKFKILEKIQIFGKI